MKDFIERHPNHPQAIAYINIMENFTKINKEFNMRSHDIPNYIIWMTTEYMRLYTIQFRTENDLNSYISWLGANLFNDEMFQTYLSQKNNIDNTNFNLKYEEEIYFHHIKDYVSRLEIATLRHDSDFLPKMFWVLRQILWGSWQQNYEDYLIYEITEYAKLHTIDIYTDKGKTHFFSYLENQFTRKLPANATRSSKNMLT